MPLSREEILCKVKKFQVEMLKESYHDLMEEGYRPLLCFILDTVYAPGHQTSQTFRRVADYFLKRATGQTLLARLLELNRLSMELDELLAEKIAVEGFSGEINQALYQRGFLACDNYEARRRHIKLFADCLTELHGLVHRPLSRFMLTIIRMLLYSLGHPGAVKALEEGYQAFSKTEDISRFIDTVKQRELQRLERIYGDTGV